MKSTPGVIPDFFFREHGVAGILILLLFVGVYFIFPGLLIESSFISVWHILVHYSVGSFILDLLQT